MRLKAPEGKGHPTVAGIVIEPRRGVYEVDPAVGKVLVESHGYIDLDAPAKPLPAAANPRGKAEPGLLRGAVLAALKTLGGAIPHEADDKIIADALVGAAKAHVDGVAEKVADAEARVRDEAARTLAADPAKVPSPQQPSA